MTYPIGSVIAPVDATGAVAVFTGNLVLIGLDIDSADGKMVGRWKESR